MHLYRTAYDYNHRAATTAAAAAAAAIPAANSWPTTTPVGTAAAELDDVVGPVPDAENETVGAASAELDPDPTGAEGPELDGPPATLEGTTGVTLDVCVTGITVSDDEVRTVPAGVSVVSTGAADELPYAVVVVVVVDGAGGGTAVRRAWIDCSRTARSPR